MGLIGFEAHQVIGAVALGQLAGISFGRMGGIGRETDPFQIHRRKMRGHRRLLVGVPWHGHLID